MNKELLVAKIQEFMEMATHDMQVCKDVRADNGYKIAKARYDAYERVLGLINEL
jgi:hypothetical protein